MQTTDSGSPSNGVLDAPSNAAGTEQQQQAEARRNVDTIRVAIVDNLLRSEDDFSKLAWRLPKFDARAWLKRERYISSLALANIENNVRNLASRPEVETIHLSDVSAETIDAFAPDAVVLSGSLLDFDFYNPRVVDQFERWVRSTNVPVLGICGGHQFVGQAFGAEVVTLDRQEPAARRAGRVIEYQYRFVKIVADDPIFANVEDRAAAKGAASRARILRVWQNHGLMVDRLPEGFKLLASGYLCPVQMMVRRTRRQLIYAVQFHIEKSFEDWGRPKTFWDHSVESRDGRVIFDNFLVEALKFRAERRAAGDDDLAAEDADLAPRAPRPLSAEIVEQAAADASGSWNMTGGA